MDISDEARDAGISAMHTLPEVSWRYEGATAAIEASAPHIAAEAGHRREIAVLKDWISRCENDYYRTLDDMVAQMRTELLALQAGA